MEKVVDEYLRKNYKNRIGVGVPIPYEILPKQIEKEGVRSVLRHRYSEAGWCVFYHDKEIIIYPDPEVDDVEYSRKEAREPRRRGAPESLQSPSRAAIEPLEKETDDIYLPK